MLVIGRALMSHPRLIMLDEPSLGLAPMLVQEIFEIIREVKAQEGVSVLLVEQNARAALELAEHGYVMENGRIVMHDTAEAAKRNPDIGSLHWAAKAASRDQACNPAQALAAVERQENRLVEFQVKVSSLRTARAQRQAAIHRTRSHAMKRRRYRCWPDWPCCCRRASQAPSTIKFGLL
jgi:ABC-type multidrug transport system ATPase subunit